MDWFANALFSLFKPESVSLTILVLSVAAAAGLGLGSIRIFGITLGIGGVLFAGLLVGQLLGPGKLSAEILDFSREFGLILFVYTIGVQVGPGFFASLRRQGLPLNLMAAAIVLLGALITIGISFWGGVGMADAVGLLCGGTTNTPSLAAASQALRENKGMDSTAGTVSAYAIAYPFGILGIILTMVMIRSLFRVSLKAENEALAREMPSRPPLAKMSLEVANPNLDGRAIGRIPSLDDGDVVVSRILKGGVLQVASPETIVGMGDVLLAVGPREALEDLRVVVGRESRTDLSALPSEITARRFLVTQNKALGLTVDELDLLGRLGVAITRIRRGEVELPPSPNVVLQFGDSVMAVGEAEALKKAAKELGDSPRQLNHPQVIPIFVGIALGVIVGSIPIRIAGIPAPVKLGLAGGPLIVAILLSRFSKIGPLVWYLPQSANFALREVGIVLFLATVGVNSGSQFFQTLIMGDGLYWMAMGALITAGPLVTVALFARMVMKLNYMSLCGLLAGSMTDPPALQFAGTVTQSDAPSIAYASVYPLVMLLRVLVAQVLVLMFV
jgi:putative transport protein